MKKTIAILLTLVLAMALAVPAFAADAAATVGYSDALVEKVDTTAMIDILEFNEYPEEDCYKITTPAGLKFLSDGVMTNYMYLSGVTVYLANDIDMTGITDFQPIGNDISKINGIPDKAFKGTFDGQGHTIDNLVMTSDVVNASEFTMVGLFGATMNVTVKNLIIGEHCSFTYSIPFRGGNHPCVAAVIVKACGTTVIENVWNRASINGGRFSAGFVARGAGSLTIENCTNSGAVNGAEQGAGGFVAYVGGTASNYINCHNTGNVTGAADKQAIAGGIVGRQRECKTVISGCVNSGNITSYNQVGGLVGYMEPVHEITGCANYGTITATKGDPAYVGQIYGQNGYSGADMVCNGNQEKAGETDPNPLPTPKTLDFTPNVGNPVYPGQETTSPEDETTQSPEGETTKAPDSETTAKPADGTAAVTDAGADAGKDDAKKGGCGSAIAGSFAILATAGIALVMTKKKK